MPLAASTAEFLRALFEFAVGEVFFCSLPNERDTPGQAGERHILTREVAAVEAFIARWDQPGRGLFFCVSTITGGRRIKANALEIAGLFSDIDFRGLAVDDPDPEAGARIELAKLRCLPSAVIHSGRGLHGYWLFNEPIVFGEGVERLAMIERVEAALRQLADHVGGDLAVCEVARLMRLPGTHNSKGGWHEVAIEHLRPHRYELDDLEEWLAEVSPVLRRRAPIVQLEPGKEGAICTIAENPFLAAALAMGFKPPVDVEQRLAAMAYGGGGDSSIHQTQLSVSASLLNAGREIEEVVGILLEATQAAAGELGSRWNWRREETAIRRMCETWIEKHPPPPARQTHNLPDLPYLPPGVRENTVNLTANEEVSEPVLTPVTDLGAERAKRKVKDRPQRGDNPAHVTVGETTLAVMVQRGERLMFVNEGYHLYRDGLWQQVPIERLRSMLDEKNEETVRALSLASTTRLITDAGKWVVRNGLGLRRDDAVFDAHGMVPTVSGLVNPRTGEVLPAAPEHYTTWRVPYRYDPAATCPLWLRMLSDMFADRSPEALPVTITLLQELLGMGLIDAKAKGLSKALVLWGPPDSGKSGALEVMAGLFGADNNTASLKSLDEPHGTVPFLTRRPWLLHEAFEQSVWHLSSIIKSIISGDEISINLKRGALLSRRVTAPIWLGTNHAPRFKDASKAIIERLVILPCRQHFPQGNPRGVALEAIQKGYSKPHELVLASEAEGILAWAVAGLRRALERGYFLLPPEAYTAARDVRLDSNPVAEFIEDCIEYDPNRMVGTTDFNASFASWWEDHQGEDRGLRPARIKAMMQSLGDQRIAEDRKELRDMQRRYYAGIAFNEEGKKRWETIVVSEAFTRPGKNASTTPISENPSRAIPPSWDAKLAVQAMRAAQAKSMTNPLDTVFDEVLVIDDSVAGGHERSSTRSSTQPLGRNTKPRFE